MKTVSFMDATEVIRNVLTSDSVFSEDPDLVEVERVVLERRGSDRKHYYVEFDVIDPPKPVVETSTEESAE